MGIEKYLEYRIRDAQHKNKRPQGAEEKWSETTCLHCGKKFVIPRLSGW